MSPAPINFRKRRITSQPLPLPSIFGRYRLIQLLAKGGMAQIYLAKSFGDEGFVKQLVIKRLDPSLMGEPYFTKLFINEAKLLVTLNHGNIVPVFDFGMTEKDLFIAMEHIPGGSLAQVLLAVRDAGVPFPHQLAAYIAVEVCKGLDYAHRKAGVGGRAMGVVHRDIKPTNILISMEGEVKIVDFGVAKLAGRLDSGPLAGTLSYMSPEQANRQTVNRRTDIFSLGLVLFEMLNGKKAYQEHDPKKVLALARTGELPPLPANIPNELQAVVAQATRKDHQERYSSAHEMEQDLTEYLILARSAGAAVERMSLSFRLSALIKELPLQGAEGHDAVPSSAPSTAEAPLTQSDPTLSGIEALPEAADMEMIQAAAETFHSEFFTRVLQEEDQTERFSSRRIWVMGGVVLTAAAMLLALNFFLAPTTPHAPQPHARAAIAPELRALPQKQNPPHQNPQKPSVAEQPAPQPRAGKRRPTKIKRRARKIGSGFLNLNSFPWSEVWVDGRKLAQHTPVLKLKLRAGRHRIRLVNREKRLRKSFVVVIKPGLTTSKVVKLR